MQNELKSKPEQDTQPRKQRTDEERRKRSEYDREYQKKNRAKLSQRQRERRVKEKRVLAVDIPKPIDETLIKKLGWIMSEERKYVLSEVLYGITPSKKASDIRDALEYFERVLFTADQLEVFGTRLRKLVVTMNLNEPKNQIKVCTERQNETIIGFKFEDEWGKIMFARFKEIKGNYCESN